MGLLRKASRYLGGNECDVDKQKTEVRVKWDDIEVHGLYVRTKPENLGSPGRAGTNVGALRSALEAWGRADPQRQILTFEQADQGSGTSWEQVAVLSISQAGWHQTGGCRRAMMRWECSYAASAMLGYDQSVGRSILIESSPGPAWMAGISLMRAWANTPCMLIGPGQGLWQLHDNGDEVGTP